MKFHYGDPLTAEDVKFSMERYRGAAGPFKARIAGVDVVDPHRVRFRFKQPWGPVRRIVQKGDRFVPSGRQQLAA